MITFRELIFEDIKILNYIRNNYANDYLHDSRIFTVEESENWFILTKPNYFSILLNNEMIGYFRLSNFSKINRNIYIGADIDPKFTGLGYGFESYKKFIPFLFDNYNLHKISLEVLSTNDRAIKLYKKLGFVVDGIKRQEILKNNKWVDSIIMSLLREEYEKFKI